MLREVVSGVWVIETPFEFVGLNMGARMTLVQRENGDLLAYAPFAISNEDALNIRELGEVRDIVAPNAAHFTQIGDFARRFPEATLWALPELRKRLKGIPNQSLENTPQSWIEEFDCLLVDGFFAFREWAFCHRASRSLIAADLGYHLKPAQTPLARVVSRLNGVPRRFGTSRFEQSLVYLGDKSKVRGHIRTILRWDFDRIVPAHGLIEEGHARKKLRLAYRFLDV